MSANEAWLDATTKLLNLGRAMGSDHGDTIEVLGNVNKINMTKPLLTVMNRKLNYGFCAEEALHILVGRNDSAPLERHIKSYGDYTHDGIHIQWAYGPKFVEQAWYCCEVLAHDSTSRRSVMSIWRENPRWEDPPCTVMLQFLVRDGFLNTMAYMRSSDVYMGLPYDMFAFTMMSAYVMILTNKYQVTGGRINGLGELTIFTGSQHLYTRNVERAKECLFGHRLSAKFKPEAYVEVSELTDDLALMASGKIPRYLPHVTTTTTTKSSNGEEVHIGK